MRERPILFAAPMVQAILADRKTQTRRLINASPGATPTCQLMGPHELVFEGSGCNTIVRVPYHVGERLWVRETWAFDEAVRQDFRPIGPRCLSGRDLRAHVMYRADGEFVGRQRAALRWRPSIHMPRWASRLTLQITNVRVERLQSISERDACAEGMGSPITRNCKVPKFKTLWDSLNAKRAPWSSNPWVWVIEFCRIDAEKAVAHA